MISGEENGFLNICGRLPGTLLDLALAVGLS